MTTENKEPLNRDALVEGFSSDWFNNTAPNDGGAFLRHPIGDYRGRVTDFNIEPTKDQKHNMMVVTITTIAVAGEGDETAIGASQVNRYGTPGSPRFMQQRARCFLAAVGLGGAFRPREILGREFDFTVSWEKSAPTVNEAGEEVTYVNSSTSFERKAGAPRPPKSNARAASIAAINYLKERGEYDEDEASRVEAGSNDEPAPWENKDKPGASGASEAPTRTNTTAPQWIPEEQITAPSVHEYRATIALGKPQAEVARKALADRKINPDGPVNAEHLAAPLRAEYEAWKAKSNADALPALPALPAPRPRTGTRNKQPPAA